MAYHHSDNFYRDTEQGETSGRKSFDPMRASSSASLESRSRNSQDQLSWDNMTFEQKELFADNKVKELDEYIDQCIIEKAKQNNTDFKILEDIKDTIGVMREEITTSYDKLNTELVSTYNRLNTEQARSKELKEIYSQHIRIQDKLDVDRSMIYSHIYAAINVQITINEVNSFKSSFDAFNTKKKLPWSFYKDNKEAFADKARDLREKYNFHIGCGNAGPHWENKLDELINLNSNMKDLYKELGIIS